MSEIKTVFSKAGQMLVSEVKSVRILPATFSAEYSDHMRIVINFDIIIYGEECFTVAEDLYQGGFCSEGQHLIVINLIKELQTEEKQLQAEEKQLQAEIEQLLVDVSEEGA